MKHPFATHADENLNFLEPTELRKYGANLINDLNLAFKRKQIQQAKAVKLWYWKGIEITA